MKTLIKSALLLMFAMALTGCMGLPFTPQTEKGVECKVTCGMKANECIGSPMNCDNAHRRCINGCRDVDRMQLNKNSSNTGANSEITNSMYFNELCSIN
jgi:hypothetical protein